MPGDAEGAETQELLSRTTVQNNAAEVIDLDADIGTEGQEGTEGGDPSAGNLTSGEGDNGENADSVLEDHNVIDLESEDDSGSSQQTEQEDGDQTLSGLPEALRERFLQMERDNAALRKQVSNGTREFQKYQKQLQEHADRAKALEEQAKEAERRSSLKPYHPEHPEHKRFLGRLPVIQEFSRQLGLVRGDDSKVQDVMVRFGYGTHITESDLENARGYEIYQRDANDPAVLESRILEKIEAKLAEREQLQKQQNEQRQKVEQLLAEPEMTRLMKEYPQRFLDYYNQGITLGVIRVLLERDELADKMQKVGQTAASAKAQADTIIGEGKRKATQGRDVRASKLPSDPYERETLARDAYKKRFGHNPMFDEHWWSFLRDFNQQS